ncbi:MAG: cysteine hydrolase [Oceanospirillales bacterium]|nr:cysteine hydrolase [Oceanospirillales bacterium]
MTPSSNPASRRALIVIDLQNDYFHDGHYPLWNSETTLDHVTYAIRNAQAVGDTVILVQHVAKGPSPFFNPGTSGVQIHPTVLKQVPNATIITKSHADSFIDTDLQQQLSERGINELLICGMMTQNCITHTALSPLAGHYHVSVVGDCCTSVDEIIHKVALRALSDRISVVDLKEVFQG